MFALMQSKAQIWEQLLYSSGGALELSKCFWYLMYWECQRQAKSHSKCSYAGDDCSHAGPCSQLHSY
jgi:hypothetical protein